MDILHTQALNLNIKITDLRQVANLLTDDTYISTDELLKLLRPKIKNINAVIDNFYLFMDVLQQIDEKEFTNSTVPPFIFTDDIYVLPQTLINAKKYDSRISIASRATIYDWMERNILVTKTLWNNRRYIALSFSTEKIEKLR